MSSNYLFNKRKYYLENSVLGLEISKQNYRQVLERAGNFREFGTVSTFNKSGTLKNTLQIVTNNNKCYLKL